MIPSCGFIHELDNNSIIIFNVNKLITLQNERKKRKKKKDDSLWINESTFGLVTGRWKVVTHY